ETRCVSALPTQGRNTSNCYKSNARSPVSSRTSLIVQSVNDSPKSNVRARHGPFVVVLEQNLCTWRRFLSIDNAWLDHMKVTLPEYVLLSGGQVQIRGQPGRHVLKFERLLVPMRRLSLVAVAGR